MGRASLRPPPGSAHTREVEILDVNRRYHDVAAADYDVKWGISFDEIGRDQVLGKVAKLLGPAAEPSRRGDRIAAVPKRVAWRLVPLWRRALGARAAPHPGQGGHAAPDGDH